MPRDDETPPVDVFAVDGEPGPDEELRYPAPNPGWQRVRLPVAAACGLALVAIVVLGVVNGLPGSTPSAGPATVTVSPPSPTSPSSTASPAASPPTRRSSAGHPVIAMPACPSDASCAIAFWTPAALTAAIHETLPVERDLTTLTTLVHADGPGSRLLARQIDAEAGAAHLRVQVRPSGQHDTIGWNAAETAQRTSVIVTHHTGGALITLRLTAPPGYGPDIPALRRLAADQRLLTLA